MEQSSENRICQNCKASFTVDAQDFEFYEKIKVPAPTFCPECRLQHRLLQRNERSLYKRKCDLCGEGIIAMYSPNKPYKVFCPSCWYGDKWDPMDYGKEYDFAKPFFAQLKELQLVVPHLSLLQERSVNSPWINYETDDKNCYLNFGGHLNEDSAYNQYSLKNKDCFDNFWLMRGEYCYGNILCGNCYKTFYSIFCYDCRDTYFSFDCRNCSNIIGCSGLRHKQYYIFNQPVTKEKYEEFFNEHTLSSYNVREELRRRSKEIWRATPQRAAFIEKSVDVTGNLIKESKNCHECLSAEKTEDSKHVLYVLDVKDSYDTTSVWQAELCHEFLAGLKCSNIKFCTAVLDNSSRLEYCHLMFNCHDCFGCINLRNKSHCILNKQYSKEEYETLVDKIKTHMGKSEEYGKFFPAEFSPFSYDETVAYEWFPLDKDEIIKRGFNWDDHEAGNKYEISSYTIPDDIGDVKDDILEKILKCERSGKPYRIIPMELEFCRKFNVPIPRLAPFERHRERLEFIVNHHKLHLRKCGGCDQQIDSVYTENEFPIVYCDRCYQAEVI